MSAYDVSRRPTSPPEFTAAFHSHIGAINRRRIVPLSLATAALLGLALILNLATGSRITDPSPLQNASGVALSLLVVALARWSPNPGLSAIVYGYSVLLWGNNQIGQYLNELLLRHADHASQQYVVYYVTRYLAAVSVVWRPRDLFIALLANHLVSLWPLIPVAGVSGALLYPAIWTATAFIAAVLIYRAERDTFAAGVDLQRQRDELAEANQRLELLNQEKNDLMAIAAHDLRSPLIAMTTLLRLAIDHAEHAWAAGVTMLRTLERSGHDMADLVTRVLDAHQAEDRLGQLALQPSDIRPVINRSVDVHGARAAAKQIGLTVNLPDGPCVAVHDEAALLRIVDNLVSNAIKFSPRGGTVSVAVTPTIDGATISVSDSGPGIAADERPRLFRKFARLRPRPTDGESSSGLGLYITRKLADAMGGSIAIADGSAGATFVVTLRRSA